MPIGHLVADKTLYDGCVPEMARQFEEFLHQGTVTRRKVDPRLQRYDWELDHPDFLEDQPDNVYTLYFANVLNQWGNREPRLRSLRLMEGKTQRLVRSYP